MAWLAIDKVGRETISNERPYFDGCEWSEDMVEYRYGEEIFISVSVSLPKGTIRKILGHELTFENSPFEIQ